MHAKSKRLTVPYVDQGRRLRPGSDLFLLLESDGAAIVTGRSTITPGQVFSVWDLMSPAHLGPLTDSGRAKFCGKYIDSSRGADLEPWFLAELEKQWNREHLGDEILSEIEREELRPEAALYTFARNPGDPVYEIVEGQALTVMRNDRTIAGRVLRSGERFTPDALCKSAQRSEEYLGAALAHGKICGPVGRLDDRGKFEEFAGSEIPAIRGAAPPKKMSLIARQGITGPTALDEPVFRVEKADTFGFREGDVITAGALGITGRGDMIQAVRSLLKKKAIALYAVFNVRHGAVYVDDSTDADAIIDRWAAPKRRNSDDLHEMHQKKKQADARELVALAGGN